MKPIAELKSISSTLVKTSVFQATGFSKLMNTQITLLQIFNKQIKTLNQIGYCDYEIAYVAYDAASQLLSVSKNFINSKNKEIYHETETTLLNKRQQFEQIETFIQNQILVPTTGDPLLSRFRKLQGKEQNVSEITQFKFKDQITTQELYNLLHSNYKLLLIDYRPKKDFLYNHIKFEDIVNIEPKQVQELTPQDTDLELEEILKHAIPSEQFTRFQNRHRYDLIVIYNYKFGQGQDRFEIILEESPFDELIELLMFRNKYISSRPKILPCYLVGGVLNWYNEFGKKFIVSSPMENGHTAPSKQGIYLTSFGEYINSNKEQKESDVKYMKPVHRRNNHEFVVSSMIKVQPDSVLPPTPRSRETTPKQAPVEIQPAKKASIEEPTRKKAPIGEPPISAPPLPAKIPTVQGIVPYSPPALPEKPLAYTKPTTSSSPTISPAKSAIPPKKTTFLDSYTTGLVNLGNSCYMNCVLQCLGATQQLTTFFFPSLTDSFTNSYKQHINLNNKLGSKGILTVQFVDLLSNMFNANGKTFNPSKFKRIMGSLSPSKQFATFDQQDCIEFLNFLLDTLHEDLNQMVILDPKEKKLISELTPEQEKSRETLPVRLASTIEWERYLKLNFSIIVDYFQGQFLSQLKCLECTTTSTTYNSFSILSLPIPEKLNNSTKVSLQDCLEEFTTIELLDDNNKWYCPNCKRFTKSTKKIAITRLPQVLIINFKRFKMTYDGRFNKLETFVTYPVSNELDLTKYWPDVGTSINPNNPMSIEKERQMLETFPTRNQVPPFKYKLFGVANHFGNLTTGHYTSYVYKPGRGWCYFDDAKITYKCSESQVLNKNAYCLFFQRV